MEFSAYRLVMALHIMGVISWMAGVLYLYRLFIYHTEEKLTEVKARFEIMEHRLYKIITVPAMYFSLLMGGIMLYLNPSLFQHGWLHAKLLFVVLLMGVTQMSGPFMRKLKSGESKITSKKFRVLNEVPTILMILIVLLVILKPF